MGLGAHRRGYHDGPAQGDGPTTTEREALMELRPVDTWELAEQRESATARREALVAAELARDASRPGRGRRRAVRPHRVRGWLRAMRASSPPWPAAQPPHRTA